MRDKRRREGWGWREGKREGERVVGGREEYEGESERRVREERER